MSAPDTLNEIEEILQLENDELVRVRIMKLLRDGKFVAIEHCVESRPSKSSVGDLKQSLLHILSNCDETTDRARRRKYGAQKSRESARNKRWRSIW